MQLSEAISLINGSRKAILFLGAGFANQATNVAGQETPSSKQLVTRILQDIGVEGDTTTPLDFVVDQLRERLTPEGALEVISKQLTIKEATLEQLRIMALPWTRIYTTNIDNIGIDYSNRRCLDAATDDEPVDSGDFVYLHGCLSNCKPTNYYQKIKMGAQLYISGSHSNSQYHHLLHQDLHEAGCVFVIGYSMADPDLAQIFYKNPDLLNKCFVFSGNTNAIENHRISTIGNDTKETSSKFLELFEASDHEPAARYSHQIEVDNGGFDSKAISQAARQNLLIYGRFDRNIARSSWSDESAPRYTATRQVADEVASAPAGSTYVLHSHLGNGKSIILEQARYLCGKQGVSVFTIDPTAGEEDFRKLLQEIPQGSFVQFEGDIFFASRIQDVVEEQALRLCMTSRTTTIRVASRELYLNGRSTIKVFDCNRLTHDELISFHDLIDSMSFWPKSLASLSKEVRLGRLNGEYDASTCAIVLAIFENEVVQNEIAEQWESAAVNLRHKLDHFIVSSYMNMIDVESPPYIINQFQSFDYQEAQEHLSDIVTVNNFGIVSFSNAIIAEYILSGFIEPEAVIGAIVRFCNFIGTHPARTRHQWIVRRLLRFWNLVKVFDSKAIPEQVFDRASYIPSIADDPLFWVQYSISKMELGEYLPAKRFVDAAYAKARNRGQGFDTYQIDTHAARLTARGLIENGLREGFATDLNRAVANLAAVAGRRPEDLYHVSQVITLLLDSEMPFRYEMSEREYGTFRRNLLSIGDKLLQYGTEGISFAAERQAFEMIERLR